MTSPEPIAHLVQLPVEHWVDGGRRSVHHLHARALRCVRHSLDATSTSAGCGPPGSSIMRRRVLQLDVEGGAMLASASSAAVGSAAAALYRRRCVAACNAWWRCLLRSPGAGPHTGACSRRRCAVASWCCLRSGRGARPHACACSRCRCSDDAGSDVARHAVVEAALAPRQGVFLVEAEAKGSADARGACKEREGRRAWAWRPGMGVRAGGQGGEGRGRRAGAGGQGQEGRGRRAEAGGQGQEGRGRRAGKGGQRQEGRGRRAEALAQRQEGRGRRAEAGGQGRRGGDDKAEGASGQGHCFLTFPVQNTDPRGVLFA